MTSSLVVGLQGALTTVFTPAASCLPFNDSLKITFVNNTFFHQYHIHTECQPPSATIGGYFSPAVCPSGYNRAPGSLHSIVLRELKDNINSEIQSDVSSTRIAVGESVDFCCPAGYDANPMNNCISAMDGQTAIAMASHRISPLLVRSQALQSQIWSKFDFNRPTSSQLQLFTPRLRPPHFRQRLHQFRPRLQ
jgi:hypothetical protein